MEDGDQWALAQQKIRMRLGGRQCAANGADAVWGDGQVFVPWKSSTTYKAGYHWFVRAVKDLPAWRLRGVQAGAAPAAHPPGALSTDVTALAATPASAPGFAPAGGRVVAGVLPASAAAAPALGVLNPSHTVRLRRMLDHLSLFLMKRFSFSTVL